MTESVKIMKGKLNEPKHAYSYKNRSTCLKQKVPWNKTVFCAIRLVSDGFKSSYKKQFMEIKLLQPG